MSSEPDMIEPEDYDPFDPLDIERVEVKIEKIADKAGSDIATYLEARQRAYVRVFGGGASADDCSIVFEDLMAFCFGDSTVFHQDERIHCLLTGRQEVIRRIQDHTGLSLDALIRKYTRPATQ